MSGERTGPRLHLVALGNFAVAQPLYDLIGRHPEFLVAHRAQWGTIAGLVACLSIGVPLALILVVEAARRIHPRAAAWLQIVLVAALVALVAASALTAQAPAVAIAVAAAAGLAGGLAYSARFVKGVLALSAAGALVFPILFVATPPVWRIVRPVTPAFWTPVAERQSPVVLVIFDELGTLTLLDAGGRIDGNRYPNFAALASQSHWFLNAVAAYPYTPQAIPAIVSGMRADASSGRLPTASDHPNTLFTWLGSSHALHVAEPITSLCPEALCRDAETGGPRALASDVAFLYLHLVTPRRIAEARLPSIALGWRDFARTPAGEPGAASARADGFRRWVAGIRSGAMPTLSVIHSLLPHDPYRYLPSGRRYRHDDLAAGLAPDWMWTDSPALVETGRSRHAAQTQFADRLLGELVERLRTLDLFDRSLLVVTSDHGSAFLPGQSHRGLTAATYREILPVPLFVKLPHQQAGVVSLRRASGIDIVPTIADAIGQAVPWATDGRSLMAEQFPDRHVLEYAGLGLPPLAAFDVIDVARANAGRAAAVTGRDTLVGRAVADVPQAPPAAGLEILSGQLEAADGTQAVPPLIEGRLLGVSGGSRRLAIALDGTVRTMAETAAWGGATHFFSAWLPEDVLSSAPQRVEIFVVEGSDSDPRLVRVPSTALLAVRRPAGDTVDHLEAPAGARLPLDAGVKGVLDAVEVLPHGVRFLGWAVDARSGTDVRAILLFRGREPIGSGFPMEPRPDVADALQLDASTRVSFAITVAPERVRNLRPGELRLFAIATGAAGEIALPPHVAVELARLR